MSRSPDGLVGDPSGIIWISGALSRDVINTDSKHVVLLLSLWSHHGLRINKRALKPILPSKEIEPRWRLNRRRWCSAKHCWPSIMAVSNSKGWSTHKSSSGDWISSSSCTTLSWLIGYRLLGCLCSSSLSPSRPDRRCFRVMAGRIFSLTSHTVDSKTSELCQRKWKRRNKHV